MEGWVLDKSYNTTAILDVFESFIWTDRFNKCGDFELHLPLTSTMIEHVRVGSYIEIADSDRYMIVEQIEISTDSETGTSVLISGRSLESILDRRIVWGQKSFDNVSFQDAIETLLNENIISPSISSRRIPNFTFRKSTDPIITNQTITTQIIGDNLYSVISVLCEERTLGFRILPDTARNGFIFELYAGVDRSYAQDKRPYVVFSPDYENLLNSIYLETDVNVRTAALVGGEGEGSEQIMVESIITEASGLDRREIYISESVSSSIRDDDGENVELTPEQYKALLELKGLEELVNHTAHEFFEGEIDATQQFIYGKDFFIGDIVQVRNEYGMEAICRVDELIRTHNVNGETFIPSFITI